MKNSKTFPKTLKTKALSFMLMSSMLATSIPAHAQDQTAEFRLVATATAIRGEALGKNEMSDALKAAVQQYSLESSSEQPTDQVANLEQAWIDLQIMTPAQAHEVSQELTQQVAKSSTQSNPAALIEASTAIIENSKGAQFSGCAVAVTADAIFGVGGGVMGLYGSIIDAHDGKPASSLAKPLEAAGITAFLVAFFGLAMTMSYICH